MKRFVICVIALSMIGCAPVQTPLSPGEIDSPVEESSMPKLSSLPDLGLAPELSNTVWLNVDAPLRLADLRGKVVIIDMWTFG